VPRRRFARALVTGASSGIGLELAKELARRTTDLVLVARSRDKLDTLAEELRVTHHVDVEVLPCDLTDATARQQVEQRLGDRDRPVDLLVNNAGVGQLGPFADLDIEVAERIVALNIVAPLRLVHAALPVLTEQRGAVLNVSSMGGNQPVPQMATYAATKSFLTDWGQSLHEELRRSGVTVTTLAPGFTRTNFVAGAEADEQAKALPGFLWADAASVARAGVDAVVSGRAVITPGVVNRTGAALSAVTPTGVSRRVIGEVMRRLG
jgi:uncharacterized protein